jgi:carbamoyl-phosphate synthase large subunit
MDSNHSGKKYTKVLILGSGGLRIGQAGEFDYSGSQAIKALKQEGIKTVLMNPNIATVQTDNNMADAVYLYPLTLEYAKAVIEKEKPDGILLGFGGQTALNLGFLLEEAGVFSMHNITVLGTSIRTIRQTEDREAFKNALTSIDILSPKSFCVSNTDSALHAAEKIGYPIMLRSGFSLGGLGSGKINNALELKERAQECLSTCSQILIEEYLFGWKEFEYEIIRDAAGNKLTICNMENIDPMGVHTGESIVVAPAQTLTNHQHQQLRNIALKAAEHFNIIGECNIQFAVNPANFDYRVIEMNARLSRSSALASKATGYPLAYVAAKLTLGWLLHEVLNSVTNKTCAFFEPSLDYLVVKIPRWDTHKIRSAGRKIGSEMKSVGEVMGIGRSFPEALQKAVGMLNIGATCLSDYPQQIENYCEEIEFPTDRRLFALYQYFLQGGTLSEANKLSQIDPWFLNHIKNIADIETQIKDQPSLYLSFYAHLSSAKKNGFSDSALGILLSQSEGEIRHHRKNLGILPVVKQIDTLAGEFEAETNYLYLTYHGMEHDIVPTGEQSIIVLGSGPYSIGSSVEFDWCAVNTSRTLRECGKQTIIINSNPETVSTDYDESHRLYFEQLTLERVLDIAEFEHPMGIIVSVGGQIANNLALPLSQLGHHLLGTQAENIDKAEDREKFSALLQSLNIEQPLWIKVNPTELDNAKEFARKHHYPLIIRPSYILSGSAINIARDDASLEEFLSLAFEVSPKHPVVISKFIEDAKELEIDGVANHGDIVIEAISEHIENAGVHSGDATVVLPPQNLYLETIRRAKNISRKITKALGITGPFNIQFIAKQNHLQVIECNLRASRSLPFVSKVTNYNFIQIATKVLLNQFTTTFGGFKTLELNYVGVKVPQFSYQRLKGADPVPHIEMASTGEVACIGENLEQAFWLAWLASEQNITEKSLLVSIADGHKNKFLPLLKILETLGWKIYSTEGTHHFLKKNDVPNHFVYKSSENQEPNIQTVITHRKVNMIINIPSSDRPNTQSDGFKIRRLAIDHHIPLIANVQKSLLMLQCLTHLQDKIIPVYSVEENVNNQDLYS